MKQRVPDSCKRKSCHTFSFFKAVYDTGGNIVTNAFCHRPPFEPTVKSVNIYALTFHDCRILINAISPTASDTLISDMQVSGLCKRDTLSKEKLARAWKRNYRFAEQRAT